MTYREHRCAADREYLSAMLREHHTITGVARAAGVNRNTVYEIAERCDFDLSVQVKAANGNRGNWYWQMLEAQGRAI